MCSVCSVRVGDREGGYVYESKGKSVTAPESGCVHASRKEKHNMGKGEKGLNRRPG